MATVPPLRMRVSVSVNEHRASLWRLKLLIWFTDRLGIPLKISASVDRP